MLITVTALSVLAALVVSQVTVVPTTIEQFKIQADVTTLNQVVKSYLANGGSLAGLTNPQAVLDKLKTTLSATDAKRNVGTMTGRGVDIRLVATSQTTAEANSSAARAVWDSNALQFTVSYAAGQAGVASFDLNGGLASNSYGTESRTSSNELYNGSDGWVWANGSNVAGPYQSPSEFNVGSPSFSLPVLDPTMTPPSPSNPITTPFMGSIIPSWISPLGGAALSDTIDNSNPNYVSFTNGNAVPSASAFEGNLNVPSLSFNNPTNTTVNGPLIGTKNGTLGNWNYSIGTLVGLAGASVTFGSSGLSADGSQVAELKQPGLLGAISSVDLNQTLSGLTLSANTTYTLMFDAAASANLLQVLSAASASLSVGGTTVASLTDASLLNLLQYPNSMTPVELSFTTGATAPTGSLGVDFNTVNLVNALGAVLYLSDLQLASGAPNLMTFSPGSINGYPDTMFTLGQLTVDDGVTFNASAATGVTLHLMLAVTAPTPQTIPVDIYFTIVPPADGTAANDSVTLTNPVTNATISLGGNTYRLNVGLSSSDVANGSVAGNTITVLPGKTVTVQLNGIWQ